MILTHTMSHTRPQQAIQEQSHQQYYRSTNDHTNMILAQHDGSRVGYDAPAWPLSSSFRKQSTTKIHSDGSCLLEEHQQQSKKTPLESQQQNRRMVFRFQKHVSFGPADQALDAEPSNSTALLVSYSEDAPAIHSETLPWTMWYQPHDFERFKNESQLEASKIQWTPESSYFVEALNETHSGVLRLAQRIDKKLANKKNTTDDSDFILSCWNQIFHRLATVDHGVAQWCSSSYRGLERHASKQLRHAKWSTRRKIARDLSLQQEPTPLLSSRDDAVLVCLDNTRTNNQTSKRLSTEELAERLQRRSEASRMFARMIGVADEWAVQREDETNFP